MEKAGFSVKNRLQKSEKKGIIKYGN